MSGGVFAPVANGNAHVGGSSNAANKSANMTSADLTEIKYFLTSMDESMDNEPEPVVSQLDNQKSPAFNLTLISLITAALVSMAFLFMKYSK